MHSSGRARSKTSRGWGGVAVTLANVNLRLCKPGFRQIKAMFRARIGGGGVGKILGGGIGFWGKCREWAKTVSEYVLFCCPNSANFCLLLLTE
jgi:hypothetical protein